MDEWKRSEDAAHRYMLRRGWCPVARNWRGADGELDIVMRRFDVLAIIEVKARSDPRALVEPVTARQRERIIRAARALLVARPDLGALSVRFDLIAVDQSRGGRRLRHLPAAFSPPDPRTDAAPRRWDTPPTGTSADGSP